MSSRKQEGVALVVSMLVLMLIAVLGVSAMRMSLFNAKVAAGAQANTLAFQAAESAISSVYSETQGTTSANSVINGAIAAFSSSGVIQIQHRCVTAGDLNKRSACGSGDFLGSRGVVKAGSQTILTGRRLAPGSQASYAGSGMINYGYYDFLTAASGEVPSMNVSSHNVQEFTKFGPLVGTDN